jgi:diguanylate cyclase (GGDEF)-like protein
VSLLMIDIDHFKSVNDRYGHPAGDRVLRDVARLLQEGVRTVDTVGRYGGEEFVAILPQTEMADARQLAERLRRAIEAHVVKVPAGEIRVTVSIGVAKYPAVAIATPDDLVRAADQALYRAKEEGRNRVA